MVYDMADNCEYTLHSDNDNCDMEGDMCNDLINRQDAINTVASFIQYYNVLLNGENISTEECERVAKSLLRGIPAVETETKWISCEEKMPEEDLWTGASQQYSYGVLMYVLDRSDGDTIIDFGHTIDGKWYSDTANTYVENYSCKVIAWMLPPSYKENKR